MFYNRRLKPEVLFIAQFPPPVHGASVRNQSIRTSALVNEGVHLSIMPLRFAASLADIGAVRLPKVLKSFFIALQLAARLVKSRPDVVVYTFSPNGAAFWRDWFLILIIKFFRIKTMLWFHEMGAANAMRSFAKRYAIKAALERTTIVCLSNLHRVDFSDIKHSQIVTVNYGTEVIVDEDKIEYRLNGPTKLLYLSNLIVEKGVYDFIDSLEVLTKNGVNYEASIVGQPLDIKLEEIQERARKNGITIAAQGGLFGADKFKVILECDIFVFPTFYRKEVFPNVILEAMQCGRPIVSTAFACIPDMIEDGVNGFIVEPRNPLKLASAISKLVNDRTLCVTMGKANRDKFMNRFRQDIFEQTLLNLILKVANTGRN